MSVIADNRVDQGGLAAAVATKPVTLDRPRTSIYPPGATNANWFGLFNAMSWQITLGSPVILYAKSLGASATILGVIAALTPLLVIFQIPAAHYLPRYGYRRFILAGWGSRALFIFAIAGIPLLAAVPAAWKLALLLLCLFAFNLLRGITAGAWFPWITELIPEPVRGRFLSRDQIFAQVGSLAALTIAATSLRGQVRPWQFAVVFLLSAISATVSLWFLKRMPDVTAPEKLKRSGHRVPWAAMIAYRPFLRMTIFYLLYTFATAGLAVFTVAYLKGRTSYTESQILWLTLFQFVGALATVTWVGRLVDAGGSKPVLLGGLGGFVVVLATWWAIAGGLIAPSVALVAGINLLTGIVQTNFGVANSRLIMQTVPLMGRNHFFALYTVITSLAMGLTPIVWGIILDAIGTSDFVFGAMTWNRFGVFFAASVALAMAAAAYVPWLIEKHAPVPAEKAVTPMATAKA